MRYGFYIVLALLPQAAPGQPIPTDSTMPHTPNIVLLPWHIYRHYPADYSRWREAAVGFRGWSSDTRELDLSRTCLALMHLPDTGLRPGTEFGPDCPSPNELGTVEWVPRTMDVVTFRLPPLVAAARAAGLQVAHVGVYGGIYLQGPIWERCVKEAGDPPPPDQDVIVRDAERLARHTRDVFDLPRPENPQAVLQPPADFALPKELWPQGDDIIAQYPWQLHRLLKSRDIDHIVYCGWALNWCLWFAQCGMVDMDRKGYMCSAVRGGCVAIENAESTVGERNLEYAYWKTSTMFGYVFDLHELTVALRARAIDTSPQVKAAPDGEP